ncbi:Hypothetical predicted protein [Pelobates cultripes]|uniref:Uncharacterized protein n=1 Tax=Pelobates cultripes TaxID=61616 RepID=A0AAD1SVV5_PELCU|nr:Hypothetical predicted protein [Pelobates cultripes]
MLCRPDKAAPRVRGRLGGQGPAEVEPQCGSWHPRSPSGGPDGGGETTGGKAASGGGRGRRLSAAARTSHQARLELQAAGSGTKYETAERSGSEHGGRTGKRAETAESSGDELGGTDTADRPFPERGGNEGEVSAGDRCPGKQPLQAGSSGKRSGMTGLAAGPGNAGSAVGGAGTAAADRPGELTSDAIAPPVAGPQVTPVVGPSVGIVGDGRGQAGYC